MSLPMMSHNLDNFNSKATATGDKNVMDRSHDSRPQLTIDKAARVFQRKDDFERNGLGAMIRCTEPALDQANKHRAIWQICV